MVRALHAPASPTLGPGQLIHQTAGGGGAEFSGTGSGFTGSGFTGSGFTGSGFTGSGFSGSGFSGSGSGVTSEPDRAAKATRAKLSAALETMGDWIDAAARGNVGSAVHGEGEGEGEGEAALNATVTTSTSTATTAQTQTQTQTQTTSPAALTGSLVLAAPLSVHPLWSSRYGSAPSPLSVHVPAGASVALDYALFIDWGLDWEAAAAALSGGIKTAHAPPPPPPMGPRLSRCLDSSDGRRAGRPPRHARLARSRHRRIPRSRRASFGSCKLRSALSSNA